jgi:hypothetical protein
MSLARLPMEEMKVMFGAFLDEHLKLSREFGSRSPLTNRLPTPGDCSEFREGLMERLTVRRIQTVLRRLTVPGKFTITALRTVVN